MDSELDIARKNLIRRLKELDQFKHSGSVKEGEIEKLQKFIKTLEGIGELDNLLRYHKDGRKARSNKKKKKSLKELNRKVTDTETLKIDIKTKNEKLDKCEERFRKYNIPKRYQNGHKQPLKGYVEALQEFMEITWRKEAKKNREKGYWSLTELLRKMGITEDDDEEDDCYYVYDSIQASLEKIGTEISSLFSEYFFLLIVASNASNEMVSRSLDEILTVVECLSLEPDNDDSLVNNMFVKVVRFFIDAMELAGPFWNNGDEKKAILDLDEEMEDDVVHLIITEILRLEVSFCSPDFIPMMLVNEVLFSMSVHLESNVFKNKLERLEDKIDEWKSHIEFAKEGDQDQDCPEMKFFTEVLEAGVDEICSAYEDNSWIVVKVVSK